MDPFAEFTDFVTSVEELTGIIGEPMPQVLAKELDHLDSMCRDFISRAPFCILATSRPGGPVDLSPKGDPPGFVKVLSNSLIAIPDRPGNRRLDTFHNLQKDPRIGLIFLVPGRGETLRVSGEARIVRDEALLASMAVNERAPTLALVVHVTRAFMHCPKCVMRSKIWQPDAWGNNNDLGDITDAMIKHAHIDATPEEWMRKLEKEGELRLY